MKIESKKSFVLPALLALLAVLGKLLFVSVHNFAILESLALFSGAYMLLKRFAFIVPILGMFISDFVINNTIYRGFFPNQEGLIFFSQYMIWGTFGIVLIVVFGKLFLKKVNITNVSFGIIGATLIFWVVTNFGSWLTYSTYPKNLGGLMSSYIAGLPFLKYSLMGNAIFGLFLFGGYELLKSKLPTLATAEQTN